MLMLGCKELKELLYTQINDSTDIDLCILYQITENKFN